MCLKEAYEESLPSSLSALGLELDRSGTNAQLC